MALAQATAYGFHVLPSSETHADGGRAWSPFIDLHLKL